MAGRYSAGAGELDGVDGELRPRRAAAGRGGPRRAAAVGGSARSLGLVGPVRTARRPGAGAGQRQAGSFGAADMAAVLATCYWAAARARLTVFANRKMTGNVLRGQIRLLEKLQIA